MKKCVFVLLIFCAFAAILAAFFSCTFFGKPVKGKMQLTEDMVRGLDVNCAYVYTGKPIVFPENSFYFYADGDFVASEYFDVEYKNNVNVGEASIVFTAKKENPKLKGSVEICFTIVADPSYSFEENSIVLLNEKLADPNITAIAVWSPLVIEKGETLFVPEGSTLYLSKGVELTIYGEFVNEGKVVVTHANLYNGGTRDTLIKNNGRIVNRGEMELKAGAVVQSFGVFESEKEIVLEGVLYVCDERPSFIRAGQNAALFVRKKIEESDVTIAEEGRTFRKNVFSYEPEVTLEGERKTRYAVSYSNNDKAGEASVTVSASDDSQKYYGEITLPFTILRGTAEASDLAELKTHSESGNFKEYHVSILTIEAGDGFSLKEGESLFVSTRFDVNGSFLNAGATSAFLIEEGESGRIENDGSLELYGRASRFNGAFDNKSTGVLLGKYPITFYENASLKNEGEITFEQAADIKGSIENEATILFSSYATMGATAFVKNAGAMTYCGNAYFYAGARIENTNGEIALKADTYFYDMDVENGGIISNEGRISVRKVTRFENAVGGFVNKAGRVWTFDPLENLTENVVYRKYLTSDDVTVSPEFSEVIYDGMNKIPRFTVNGANIPQEEYSISMKYIDRTDKPTDFSKAGTVEVKLHVGTDFSAFAGDYAFQYVIKRARVEVGKSYDLSGALADDGYGEIYLTDDVVYNSSRAYLLSTATLNLNGHRLTLNGTFSNYGTIVSAGPLPNDFLPSEESASIVVTESAYFYNYGNVENERLIFVKGAGHFSANAQNSTYDTVGTLRNDGLIYTNSALTATGSGEVFVRKNVKDVQSTFLIGEARYSGEALTPSVVCHFGGSPMDPSRFELTFSKNVNAGTAFVKIKVANDFDPDLFGQASLSFAILRGKVSVSSASSFKAAAENVNYEEITLASSIALNQSVSLSDDQTLDLGEFELTFGKDVVLTMGKNCRLLLKAADAARFTKYVYGADEIELSGDISDALTIDFTSYDLSEISGENLKSTVIRTNGYSFLGGISLSNSKVENFRFTFENSSENVSTIGSGVGGYAFVYGTCYEETYVMMKNLTVYGVKHNGGSGTAQVVDLSADNCKFLASRDKQDAYAFRIWTSMTASGTYNNCLFDGANAFYVNRGYDFDHSSGSVLPVYFFNNCTLRAYGECDKTDYYGNALTLDRNKSNLNVQINDSHFYSQNGNCIRIVNRTGVYYSVDQTTTFEHPEGKANVLG